MENSSVTKKINPNNNHEKITHNLIIKLKLPKHEQDLASSSSSTSSSQDQDHLHLQNTNKSLINSASKKVVATKDKDEDEDEDGDEDEDVLPPTKEENEEVVEDDNGVDEVKLHICPSCNKGFKSKKALGGHSRVHLESNKSNTKRTTVSSALCGGSPVSSTRNEEVLLFKCTLCHKSFPSRMSLFGHMRSHPERDYRGMHPPEKRFTAAEKVVTVVGTWRMTGKRGRKGLFLTSSPVTSSSSAATLDTNAEAVAAAETLLILGRGGYEGDDDDVEVKRAKKNNNKGLMLLFDDDNERSFDDDEVYYLKNLGYLPNYKFDGEEIKVDNYKFEDNNHDDELTNKVKMCSSLPQSTTLSKFKGIKKHGKINHKIKSSNLDPMEVNQNNNNKWVCTTCGKSFPTHQALGGHRSSHNKDKTRVVDGSGLTETGPIIDNGGGGQAEVVVNSSQDDMELLVGIHKCKICDKIFASGQALGGHQRCHYVPSLDYSSSQGQSTGQTGRVGNMELIDLNLDPPMMDYEDDGDVTVDSSSNKYCS